jgi:heptosyltransferase II
MMNPTQYRFYPNVSSASVRRIKLIDSVLYFFKTKERAVLDIQAFKEITIVQFAHIGDMILILPAIKALKINSKYKINLLISSQNYAIASKLKFIDKTIIADAPYFSRNKKSSWLKYILQLRKIKTDLIYDVRGDLRNIFFIKLFVRKKIFAGYGVGGGGALLDVMLPYTHGGHVSNLPLPLFKFLNLPEIRISECWDEGDMPFEEINDVVFPDQFLAVHLGAGAQARKWPVENFIQVIKLASAEIPVYVMGVAADVTPNQMDAISSIPNVSNCIGKYSLLQAIFIIKKSTLFAGLDSGFTHIASLLKKRVIVLFSGTVNKNVWRPIEFYKDQITLLNEPVACDLVTGCGKLICEDNICMKRISPLKVAETIKYNLNLKALQELSISRTNISRRIVPFQ